MIVRSAVHGWTDNLLDPSSMTDDDLAVRSFDDREAFAELYDRYLRRIYGFCLRRSGDREFAEDATSQTFLKAFDALQKRPFRHGSFKTWLFTITYRVMIDAHRTAPDSIALPERHDLQSPDATPELMAVAADSTSELRRLVARLPLLQQDVINLNLADLTDAEIAQVLGKRAGTIRTSKHRAIRRLRELYTEQSGTES